MNLTLRCSAIILTYNLCLQFILFFTDSEDPSGGLFQTYIPIPGTEWEATRSEHSIKISQGVFSDFSMYYLTVYYCSKVSVIPSSVTGRCRNLVAFSWKILHMEVCDILILFMDIFP